MKKSILLATTALISAFALNANAVDPKNLQVDLEATVDLIMPISLESIQKLNFGRLVWQDGGKFKVAANGSIDQPAADGYMAQLGTTAVGKIKLTSAETGIAQRVSLDLPASIPMTYKNVGNVSCGSVGQLEQLVPAMTGSVSGGTVYEIAFGGVFTAGSESPQNHTSGTIGTCEGAATATLVYTYATN